MVGWQQVLGDAGVDAVADYVVALGRGNVSGHAGRAQFEQFCVACHGANGEGNAALGAPGLADDEWLYGGDIGSIRATVAHGRNGIMPAFGERLDDTQIRLLVAWLTRKPGDDGAAKLESVRDGQSPFP
jgi:cytochrome c oxidase cbb3-type subunit 3